MSYIHKLRGNRYDSRLQLRVLTHDKYSPADACSTLDDFLTLRLVADQNLEWAQKAIIVRLWISIENLTDSPEILESNRMILGCFVNGFKRPMDAGASHAAHVVSLDMIVMLCKH